MARKPAPQTVWVFSAKSESGDDYGPWICATEPSLASIEERLREEAPCEWDGDEDGPGFRGSCLHLSGPYLIEVLP